MSTSYRAIIRSNRDLNGFAPDRYGTITIPPSGAQFAKSPVPLRVWAKEALAKAPAGSVCEIYRTEEVLVETIEQEQTVAR